MFRASLHVYSNAARSSNTVNAVLRVPHTILTFRQCNYSHIWHLHMLLSNPNLHILCINARKPFPMSNLDYECPIWCTPPLQVHFMHSKQIHFICSCIQTLLLYFHPSKPGTQLCHNTRTFKIRHFGIVYQDSKDRPCSLQRPTPSFA